MEDIRKIIESVRLGEITADEAALALKAAPFADIDYAKIDLHRRIRRGAAEVIYGAGKTPEQIDGIVDAMIENGQDSILITRISEEAFSKLLRKDEMDYRKDASLAVYGLFPEPSGAGTVLVATAGTSDIGVAEEAAVTAEFLGNRVKRLYDVGVSGIHRLLHHLDDIMTASVIIVVAGMEGALASVIGGLSDCPVIAVPTSVGYGAAFEGLAALLAMLNSCASGVTVVNIDNGFGAGYAADMINHVHAPAAEDKEV